MKLTTKLIKEMVEAEIASMDEGRVSDLMTKLDQWANPGKYEDPGSDEFVEKRFDEAYQLLAAARSIISQFDKRMAGKILDVEHEVMNMRDAHRPAAAESDVVEENELEEGYYNKDPRPCASDERYVPPNRNDYRAYGRCVKK